MAAGRRQCAALLMLTLLASACVSTPPGDADQSSGSGEVRDFTLAGRLAVRQPGRSDVLRLDWQHVGDRDRIALSTPLGGQVMLLDERPGHVRLTLSDRPPVEASDDAELMQSLLGYTLPVQGLADWVLGRVPAPEPEAAALAGSAPPAAGTASAAAGVAGTTAAGTAPAPGSAGDPERIQSFRQDGWSGTLQRWRQVGPGSLPGLLTVARDTLQLRLVVDQWSVRRGQP